jgi:hypothetical protein
MGTLPDLLRALRHVALLAIALVATAGIAHAQIDVLVLGAPNTASWNNDVEAKLEATGMFNSVDVFNIASSTPTLAYLQNYDAVLVYTDGAFNTATATGNVLADYIDGGGGVVSAVFATASLPIGGAYNSSTYLVIQPAGQTGGNGITLGTVADPTHYIMNGVSTFNGGASSYMSTSTTLTTGSALIASWSNGMPLVAVKENVGPSSARRADLNFFPPSNAVRSDFWVATTDGAQLMANALIWVAFADCHAPSIDEDPADQTVCTGQTATFDVEASGTDLTYQWRKDGADLTNDGRISGAQSATLTITDATTADNGSYDVVVSGACDPSATSEAATLTVHAPPTIAVSLSPSMLWPPNHAMNTIAADVDVTGDCTPLTVELVSVVSNEPDDANGNGDGNTVNDVQGVGTGLSAIDDYSFDVRAERAASGSGRTYTATYRVTDAAGNVADASATVFVPRDQGNLKPALSVSSGAQVQMSLEQNLPNPFTSSTDVRFWIGDESSVSLKVFSLDGREIATLADGTMAPGDHTVQWDGRDASGTNVAGGVYVYRLQSHGTVLQQRMVLAR